MCIKIADWLTEILEQYDFVSLSVIFVVLVVVCLVTRTRTEITLPCQEFNYFLIHTWFWSLPEQSIVGSAAVTVIAVAPNTVVLIPIVMQLIFCFALMDGQAYLLQHKILIISWTDA